jgi:hypothetical protein
MFRAKSSGTNHAGLSLVLGTNKFKGFLATTITYCFFTSIIPLLQ